MRQNGGLVHTSRDHFLDNQTMKDSSLRSERVLLYITNLLYQKKAYFISFHFMYKRADILWYVTE